MPELIFFTGGKGGVGKTLFALGAAAACEEQCVSTLLIDMNFHNADLYHSLRHFAVDARHTIFPGGDYGIVPLHSKLDNESMFLVYPLITGKRYGRLPYRGFEQILSDIDGIIKQVVDGQLYDFSPNNWPKYVLVDTGLHLSNLMSTSAQSSTRVENRSYLWHYSVKIWFLWTIAMMLRTEENVASKDAVQWFQSLHDPKTGAQLFNESSDLLHILNPHALVYAKMEFWNSFRKDFSISQFEKFQNTLKSKVGMAFKDVYKSLTNIISSYDFRKGSIDSLCEALAISIMTASDGNEKSSYRPNNLFFNPYYSRSMMGITEKLEDSTSEMNWKVIRQIMNPLYKYIEAQMFRDGNSVTK